MRSLLQFTFASALFSTIQAACFHPNGTQTQDQGHSRCSDDPDSPIYNICCAIDRAIPSGGETSPGNFASDVCLPNGLCENDWTTEDNPTGGTSYWREECTESDWSNGLCANYCLDNVSGGNVQMTPCDGTATSETWCCGGNTKCCGKAGEIKIAATLGASPSSSSSSSSSSSTSSSSAASSTSSSAPSVESTATSTPTSTSSSSPSSSAEPSPATGLSGGAKAGVAIGAIAGVGAILAAGFLLVRRRKQQKANDPYTAPVEVGDYDASYPHSEMYGSSASHGAAKYAQHSTPHEMHGDGKAQELPAHTYEK